MDNDTAPGSPHGYVSPATIAQHQSGNPDLYRQHNPAGRMNDLTRRDSIFDSPGPYGEDSIFARNGSDEPGLWRRAGQGRHEDRADNAMPDDGEGQEQGDVAPFKVQDSRSPAPEVPQASAPPGRYPHAEIDAMLRAGQHTIVNYGS
ncbi:MAG TPA: hypothetical protein VMU95_00055 [Trebonia sp.]|nr:hypothetical protein [Trebonia sp.]